MNRFYTSSHERFSDAGQFSNFNLPQYYEIVQINGELEVIPTAARVSCATVVRGASSAPPQVRVGQGPVRRARKRPGLGPCCTGSSLISNENGLHLQAVWLSVVGSAREASQQPLTDIVELRAADFVAHRVLVPLGESPTASSRFLASQPMERLTTSS